MGSRPDGPRLWVKYFAAGDHYSGPESETTMHGADFVVPESGRTLRFRICIYDIAWSHTELQFELSGPGGITQKLREILNTLAGK